MMKILFNRKNIENPAKINLKNIKKFIQGNFYKIITKFPSIKEKFLKQSRLEQYDWRRKCVQEKSPKCLSSGECFCGCNTEGLIMANPGCEQKNHCFPALMESVEWQIYKIENNIKL